MIAIIGYGMGNLFSIHNGVKKVYDYPMLIIGDNIARLKDAGGVIVPGVDAIKWAMEVEERGAGEIMLTSMDRDGTKDGFDLELTAAICDRVNIPIITSGGCGLPSHTKEVFAFTDASAALAASIFHYKEYTVREVKRYLEENGVHVRL